MALIKKSFEIEAIRKSCQIASKLHWQAKNIQAVGLTEIELAEKLTALFKQTEAQDWAYNLLVGSGDRTTIIHAEPTDKKITGDDMILIDMGVKYNGMCSDITRTFSAGGKFSEKQQLIYDIVLKAQREVISRVKAGTNLQALHQVAKDVMLDELLSKSLIKKDEMAELFPHKTSHWIGEVVHDTPSAYLYEDGSPVELAAGMCFTVEPGLYFTDRVSEYFGIGVRIEDVVLVTEGGCEVLTIF